MELNVKLTADEMMDVVDAAVGEAMDRGYDGLDVDELTDDMCHIVDAALAAMGIEIIPANEIAEECEKEDAEEEESNPISELVFIKNGVRAIKASDAKMIAEITGEIIKESFGMLPIEIQGKIFEDMLTALFTEAGVEIVVEGE